MGIQPYDSTTRRNGESMGYADYVQKLTCVVLVILKSRELLNLLCIIVNQNCEHCVAG
uniref:Uncharacterized protein n=1 Tax=Ciona intestinalis TaxID=7719 RepID=H2Y1P2_CIOIN